MANFYYIGADVKMSTIDPTTGSSKTVAIWFPKAFATKEEACVQLAELALKAANCQRFFVTAWQKKLKLDEHKMCVGFEPDDAPEKSVKPKRQK